MGVHESNEKLPKEVRAIHQEGEHRIGVRVHFAPMRRRGIALTIAFVFALALGMLAPPNANAAITDWSVPWGTDTVCYVGEYDLYYDGHMTSRGARAIDFVHDSTIPLYAPTDGTIVALQDWYDPQGYVGNRDATGYGNFIAIATDDGYGLIMAHFSRISPALAERFRNGDWSVKRGEYLGNMGTSGNSSGIHLHFEVFTSRSTLGTLFGMKPQDFVFGNEITGEIEHEHNFMPYLTSAHQEHGHRVVFYCDICGQSDGQTYNLWTTSSSCASCPNH